MRRAQGRGFEKTKADQETNTRGRTIEQIEITQWAITYASRISTVPTCRKAPLSPMRKRLLLASVKVRYSRESNPTHREEQPTAKEGQEQGRGERPRAASRRCAQIDTLYRSHRPCPHERPPPSPTRAQGKQQLISRLRPGYLIPSCCASLPLKSTVNFVVFHQPSSGYRQKLKNCLPPENNDRWIELTFLLVSVTKKRNTEPHPLGKRTNAGSTWSRTRRARPSRAPSSPGCRSSSRPPRCRGRGSAARIRPPR